MRFPEEWGTIAKVEGFQASMFFGPGKQLDFCEAISRRDTSKIEKMLKEGFDLNQAGKFGVTPLMWAYIVGDLPIFKVLVQHGADVDKKLASDCRDGLRTVHFMPFLPGDTVLRLALRHRKSDYFLAAFPQCNDPFDLDADGQTLLHSYFSPPGMNSMEALDALLAAGVELDRRHRLRETACHEGVKHSRVAAVLKILKAGASPDIPDRDGKTVREIAIQKLDYYKKRKLAAPSMDVYFIASDLVKEYTELVEWLDQHPVGTIGTEKVEELQGANHANESKPQPPTGGNELK
ncbi:ankyrin repeat domain-containing protein [Novipirellula artificiosorum]|uniref:ankyrin repeat domain-containing protein n=1 Tax=Novipirellula artificiosorum TaxID=2528016 RepID=UPI0018CD7638|nr:hypothetical protein [Novipirellula artificiosorum]